MKWSLDQTISTTRGLGAPNRAGRRGFGDAAAATLAQRQPKSLSDRNARGRPVQRLLRNHL